MPDQSDEFSEWNGRDLFDAGGERIGSIAGLAYPRKRFGATWLLVDTAGDKKVIVPAGQIQPSPVRLVLPYPRSYVDSGPAVEPGLPLTQAEERRLRLHYGISSGVSGACRGCGLCMAKRRAQRGR